jgi:predicted outer membrane protein
MKSVAWLTLLAAVPLAGAAAQDKTTQKKEAPPPPAARGQLPAHYKKLGLSADQTEKVRTIRAEYRARADRLREQLRQLAAEEKGKLEGVLTEEQRKRLRELRAGGAEKK